MDRHTYKNRIRLVVVGFLLVSVLLVIRLIYLQVIHHDAFVELASHQYVAPQENSFDRGSIFFKTKEGELLSGASRMTAYTLSINPKLITDPESVFVSLSQIIPTLSHDEFMQKASKTSDPYEEILKKLTEDEKQKISALKIKGIGLYPEYYRFYPYQDLGSQVLGFVGWNREQKLTGQYGIERYYNNVLSRSNNNVYVNFFAEVFADLSKTLFSADTEREGDVILTIDPNVEMFAHQLLIDLHEEWHSETAGIIVMDPKTGAIIAMESTPSFNQNNRPDDTSVYSNPLVEDVYEMGSIIKPITVASGLDAGVINLNSRYVDTGEVVVNGMHIRNYDGRARGDVNVQEILSQSLNVGTVHVVRLLGGDTFKKYMDGFGLTDETGIDLPNEAVPLVSNLSSDIEVDHLTAGFGQGIAISPIQTIRALSVLANGGKLVNPHVVDSIDYTKGGTRIIVQPDETQVISQKASQDITSMLVTVVDKALKGGIYKIPEYSVAAKTGTAQIANKTTHKYYDDRYLHSFFGYFPAYNPRFIVFMFHTYPKNAQYASDTLTKPFFKMAKYLLNYYEVPPDRDKETGQKLLQSDTQ